MSLTRAHLIPVLLSLLIALTAVAGRAALEPVADSLVSDYELLDARIAACPDGDCSEAKDILDDLDALDLDLAELEADRAELEPCDDCELLDALIDDAVVLSNAADEDTGGWTDVD